MGLWRLCRTWEEKNTNNGRIIVHLFLQCSRLDFQTPDSVESVITIWAADSLLASSMSFTARQRDFNHAGGESHPQSMTLAVYLHANDALVLHAVYAASVGATVEIRESVSPIIILWNFWQFCLSLKQWFLNSGPWSTFGSWAAQL